MTDASSRSNKYKYISNPLESLHGFDLSHVICRILFGLISSWPHRVHHQHTWLVIQKATINQIHLPQNVALDLLFKIKLISNGFYFHGRNLISTCLLCSHNPVECLRPNDRNSNGKKSIQFHQHGFDVVCVSLTILRSFLTMKFLIVSFIMWFSFWLLNFSFEIRNCVLPRS